MLHSGEGLRKYLFNILPQGFYENRHQAQGHAASKNWNPMSPRSKGCWDSGRSCGSKAQESQFRSLPRQKLAHYLGARPPKRPNPCQSHTPTKNVVTQREPQPKTPPPPPDRAATQLPAQESTAAQSRPVAAPTPSLIGWLRPYGTTGCSGVQHPQQHPMPAACCPQLWPPPPGAASQTTKFSLPVSSQLKVRSPLLPGPAPGGWPAWTSPAGAAPSWQRLIRGRCPNLVGLQRRSTTF